MLNETFTTHITFTSGDTHREEPITAESLSSTITRLCEGPAAVMGMIKRVIIVDQLDRTCVEIKGRNIVYPNELALKQRVYRIAQKRANKSK
jgi:hypothetical protein